MIYLDNAATTYPKPDTVYEAVKETMEKYGANPGRGSYKLSIEASRLVFDVRNKLAKFFNVENPFNIIFTLNCTMSINIALKGLLKPGDHVIVTSMEHNSVIRPLEKLKSRGINYDVVWCDEEGLLNAEDIKKLIRKETKLIVSTAASNVFGSIMPIEAIGEIAKEYGLIFMVDGAQGVGYLDIDTKKENIDLLAFPGHKGLYGPQGTGGLYCNGNIKIDTILEGGTGSYSDSVKQPEILPDMLESGTINVAGIGGLGAGLDYINKNGLEKLYKKEMELTDNFIKSLKKIEGIKVYGPQDITKRIPVVSLNIDDIDSTLVSHILDSKYDIATRSGLHCAVMAHRTLKTLKQGTVRFSFGSFNTNEDVDFTTKALYEITKKLC